MRDSWIRLKVAFRSGVIAPIRGLAGPLKSLVVTPEGKARWIPVGALVFIFAVTTTGIVISLVQGFNTNEIDAQPSAPVVESSQSPKAPSAENQVVLRGSDVELNPPSKTNKNGQVPFVKTASPGEFAEAYTRTRLTMDMSKDTAQSWLDAEARWRTNFVPTGFEDWAWTQELQTENRAGVFNVWARFVAQEPAFSGFTTGIHIDRELADVQAPITTIPKPSWAAQIDSGEGLHLIRTSWVASAFATKNGSTTAPLLQGSGSTEMLIACPGLEGFKDDSCKIVYATDTLTDAPSSVMKAWPNK